MSKNLYKEMTDAMKFYMPPYVEGPLNDAFRKPLEYQLKECLMYPLFKCLFWGIR